MADNQRTYQRNIKGQFAKVDVERDVLAPGLGVPEKFAYDLTTRHAPAGDDLAQGGLDWPPGVRAARMVSGGSERTVYATPRAGTLNDAVHTGESGRLGPQQEMYIMGDVDEPAPGDVAATQRFGVQGRHVRAAARRGSDPMDPSAHLTGADLDGR